MLKLKLARPMLVALAACAASVAFNGVVFADDAQDAGAEGSDARHAAADAGAAEARSKRCPEASSKPPSRPAVAPRPDPRASPRKRSRCCIRSSRASTARSTSPSMTSPRALRALRMASTLHQGHLRQSGPARRNADSEDRARTERHQAPVGQVGYQPELSTNKSVLGYRGSHQIGDSDIDFIYPDRDAAVDHLLAGPQTSYTQQSNVVKGAIGYGDTFVGIGRRTAGLGQAQVRHDVRALQEIHRPDESLLGHARRLRRHHGQYRRRQPRRIRHPPRSFDLVRIAASFDGIFSFDLLVSPGRRTAPTTTWCSPPGRRTATAATRRAAATCC